MRVLVLVVLLGHVTSSFGRRPSRSPRQQNSCGGLVPFRLYEYPRGRLLPVLANTSLRGSGRLAQNMHVSASDRGLACEFRGNAFIRKQRRSQEVQSWPKTTGRASRTTSSTRSYA